MDEFIRRKAERMDRDALVEWVLQLYNVAQERRNERNDAVNAVLNALEGSAPDTFRSFEDALSMQKARVRPHGKSLPPEDVTDAVQLISHLRSELEACREENTELRKRLANTDAATLTRAVADAHRNGERWASGRDLLVWLSLWTEENLSDPMSEATIRRRFVDAGLWQSGRNGIRETVRRCIEFAAI
jgi:hypothetical protein